MTQRCWRLDGFKSDAPGYVLSARKKGRGLYVSADGSKEVTMKDYAPGKTHLLPPKVGSAARHALGVLFEAPWHILADGFSEHGRRLARALHDLGCPTHLRARSYSSRMMDTDDRPDYLEPILKTSVRDYSCVVHHVVLTDQLAHALVSHPFYDQSIIERMNKRRVISTVFEVQNILPQMAGLLNQVAQVWVACEDNREMLERSGVLPEIIRVIPIPFRGEDPLVMLRGRIRRNGIPRFYHIGKWEPRKAQDKLIAAFMNAFRPGEASLTMKVSNLRNNLKGYPMTPQEVVGRLLQHPQIRSLGWTSENADASIQIVSKRLTDKEIVQLHAFGDAYVSLSRGEGFDMPAFDAKIAGNWLVYTPSGGPQDFAGPTDFAVKISGLVPVHPFYRWGDGVQYLDYRVEDASDALKRAAKAIREAAAPSCVEMRFESTYVGKKMLRCLDEVTKSETFDLDPPKDKPTDEQSASEDDASPGRA